MATTAVIGCHLTKLPRTCLALSVGHNGIGARQLHAVFERIQMSRDIFESRAYTRLKQIQYLCDTSQLDEHFFWHSVWCDGYRHTCGGEEVSTRP